MVAVHRVRMMSQVVVRGIVQVQWRRHSRSHLIDIVIITAAGTAQVMAMYAMSVMGSSFPLYMQSHHILVRLIQRCVIEHFRSAFQALNERICIIDKRFVLLVYISF